MAAVSVTPDDLAPFATIDPVKAQAMIDDAMARAAVVAPCILTDEFEHDVAAKSIIRGAILRWNDSGSGTVTQQTAGPYGITVTESGRKGMFWPSELDELKALCGDTGGSGAFSVDTVGSGTIVHTASCSLYFGAEYCSCGAVLTQSSPLWEDGL